MSLLNWCKLHTKTILTTVTLLVMASVVGYFLGNFLSDKYICNVKVARPVIDEWKKTSGRFVELRNDILLEKVFLLEDTYNTGKLDQKRFKELEKCIDDWENIRISMALADLVLEKAIDQNDERLFYNTIVVLTLLNEKIEIMKEKLERYRRSFNKP